MRPLLGTFVEIEADGTAPSLVTAIEAAFAAVARVHRLMSFQEAGSDVSRINAAPAGESIRIDRETFAVLRTARAIGDASDGAFDIAVAPILIRQGFLPDTPAASGEDAAASYRDLELLPGARARWRRKGRIDLSGIAKGHAVDRAVEVLRSHGVPQGLVNAGGDLRCFGAPQPLHVRAPADPGSLLRVGSLASAAAATSAGYFHARTPCRGRADPLVDPARGACVPWRGSCTVIADECITADALTKVVGLSPTVAPAVLARFGAQAVLLDERGMWTCGRHRLDAAS